MTEPKKNGLHTMALTSMIVAQLAGSILIGVFSGRFLDQYFDLSPLFLIIGVLLGLTTGVISMLQTVKKYL